MTTIRDVAKAAGVAPSTVSRVLSGSSRISPATQERVRAAVAKLNYYPNAIARSLAGRATHTIGIVIARPAQQALANPFFPELLRGVGTCLQGRNYNLLLSMTGSPAEERTACMRMVHHRQVDGVILTSSRTHDRLIDELMAEEFPFVLVGRVDDQLPINWVNNDNAAVGAMAVEHLIARGHRRIGLVAGPPDLTVTIDRRRGFEETLARAGLPLTPKHQVNGAFTKEGGYRGMGQLLSQPEPPTAVFCTDDAMAVGALMALKERDLAHQVAVVGVNDDPLTALIDPSLTTVRIPVFELGNTAAQILVDQLRGVVQGPRQVILPSQLVVRESTNWTLA